ncbi:MAG: ABC transporter substrate-binding protein [Candidatus Thermoplasmatota archaeon]|nr:ABC transporter substrate-binding protein [Candidatus Thermoplasmatota archaeon]
MGRKSLAAIFMVAILIVSMVFVIGISDVRSNDVFPAAGSNVQGFYNYVSTNTSSNSTLSVGLLLSDYSWTTMNPLTVLYTSSGLNYLFYTPLVYVSYPPDAGVHGCLLQSWSSNPSYTTWNLTLKPGLKWDNGQALNATDLAWTLDFYNESVLGNAWSVHFTHNATILNSTTVEVQFAASMPNFMVTLGDGDYNVVYAPDFENIPMSDMNNFTNFKNIVMDAPYVIYNYTVGENPVVFTRNPYYFNGTPYYKNLVVHIYDSTSAEVTALSSGTISAVWVGGSYTTAKAFVMPGHSVYATVPAGEEMVQFDYLAYPTNLTDVRLALSYAVNRTELSMVGYGSPNYTQLNWATLTPAYDKALGIPSNYLPNYSQNLSMVDKCMEKAGFSLVNGVWTNSTGSPVTLNVIYPNYETESTDIAVELESEWKAAGFDVSLQSLTSTAFTSARCADPPTFQAAVWQGYGFGIDYDSFITNLYLFYADYGSPVFNHNVATLGAIYGHTVPNGTFASIWADAINASEYPLGSSQANYWNRLAAYEIATYVPMIPLYYTYNFEAVSNNVYFGSPTNHTGIFSTQALTMPQFWDGTLVSAHPIITPSKPAISTTDYIIIGVVIAVVAIGGVGYAVSSRRKRGGGSSE